MNEDELKKLLKKAVKEIEPDPEVYKDRRNTFIRWQFSRKFGCFIFWFIVVTTILLYIYFQVF